MKNDNKKRKGKGSLIIIIETLVCTVVFMAIILLTLLLLDKEYSKVHSIMTCFKGGIHPHFSGDTWFSIAASGMAAIPGVFCGILALLQTERINKMEARYHRPVLGFQNASMKIMRLHDERYQKKSKVKDYEEVFFCEWLVKKKPEKNFKRISLELVLELKNDTEIYDIILDQISFWINNKCYIFQIEKMPERWSRYRKCTRVFENDKYLCIINWDIFPYKIVNWKDSKDDIESVFGRDIDNFANYDRVLMDNYRTINIDIQARCYYQYSNLDYALITIRTQWDVQKGTGIIDYESNNQTRIGHVTYNE